MAGFGVAGRKTHVRRGECGEYPAQRREGGRTRKKADLSFIHSISAENAALRRGRGRRAAPQEYTQLLDGEAAIDPDRRGQQVATDGEEAAGEKKCPKVWRRRRRGRLNYRTRVIPSHLPQVSLRSDDGTQSITPHAHARRTVLTTTMTNLGSELS